MTGRKTVLIVDDDPGILYVLANGLSTILDMYDVVTAGNGREAVEVLEQRPVDVLVTDLAMPVMDGFALIAYVTNQRSTLPVVVLSGMASHSVDQRLSGFGGLRVLSKPASYQDVAQCVLEEIERVDMGQVEGIPLAGVLQLVESERRSCTVIVRSGKRRGRLQFESGRLMNAFSEDFGAEGEAAAYDILSWADTAIEFEHLPNTVRKLIHTPMQLMLIELAVVQDQIRGHDEEAPDVATEGSAPPATPDDRSDAAAATEPAEVPHDEAGAGFVPDGHADLTPADGGDVTRADRAHDEPVVDTDPVVVAAAHDGDEVGRHVADAGSGHDDAEPAVDRPAKTALAAVRSHDRPTHVSVVATPFDSSGGAPMPDETKVDRAAEQLSAAPTPTPADDAHVDAMLLAVERLADRARAADDALAAVAVEVDAFRAAQRRFDQVNAQREARRQELEAFRDDVARLAREILGRVEGLFDDLAPERGREAAPRRDP
jgi:CheY-like chemotaxis protein